jgi:hypothetical protein
MPPAKTGLLVRPVRSKNEEGVVDADDDTGVDVGDKVGVDVGGIDEDEWSRGSGSGVAMAMLSIY